MPVVFYGAAIEYIIRPNNCPILLRKTISSLSLQAKLHTRIGYNGTASNIDVICVERSCFRLHMAGTGGQNGVRSQSDLHLIELQWYGLDTSRAQVETQEGWLILCRMALTAILHVPVPVMPRFATIAQNNQHNFLSSWWNFHVFYPLVHNSVIFLK